MQLGAEHRLALLEERTPIRRFVVREFANATEEFPEWAKMEYRAHPNNQKRIATSLSSARTFFGKRPVGTILESEIEAYKVWHVNEHKVRDITLRHDLHDLSTFFQYGTNQRWSRENPIRNVKIPSDEDVAGIRVITLVVEREYLKRAAKNRNLCDLARLIQNQGMRPEEVLSLWKEDIDLVRHQLRVRFGRRRMPQGLSI